MPGCFEVRLLILLAVLMFTMSLANAESYSANDGQGNRIVLTDKACSLGGWLNNWRQADFTYQGKYFKSCWRMAHGVVFVLDESGDLTALPVQMFSKDQES